MPVACLTIFKSYTLRKLTFLSVGGEMMIQKKLKSILLCVACGASSIALAERPISDGNFYVGGIVASGRADFSVNGFLSDNLGTLHPAHTVPFYANLAGLGFRTGYQNYSSDYGWALELDANQYYGEGRATITSSDTIQSQKNKLKHEVSIVYKPGLKLTDTVKSYLIGGATYGQFQSDAIVEAQVTAFPVTSVRDANNKKNLLGFSLGFGVEKVLKNRWSIVAEYHLSEYGSTHLKTLHHSTAQDGYQTTLSMKNISNTLITIGAHRYF